jgi:hypothetical protein
LAPFPGPALVMKIFIGRDCAVFPGAATSPKIAMTAVGLRSILLSLWGILRLLLAIGYQQKRKADS